MEFRKATQSNFNDIIEIYQAATQYLDAIGIHQWDAAYPSKNIIKEDIQNQEMYVGLIDGIIVTAFTLNPNYEEEYALGNWQYNHLPFSVVHRFCVNPACQNKGIGTKAGVHKDTL